MKIPLLTIGGALIGLSLGIPQKIISGIFAGMGIFIIGFAMGRYLK